MFTHPAHARTVRYYHVRRGDTLSGIAKKKHVNLYALAKRNHMQLYDILLVGRRLTLPRPGKIAPSMPWYAPVRHVSTDGPAQPVANTESPAQDTPAATAPSEYAGQAAGQETTPVTAPASYSGSGMWSCIVSHESGGDPQAVNPSSGASGLVQFLPSTWTAVSGLPGTAADYPAATQMQVAQKLQSEEGWSPWETDGCV